MGTWYGDALLIRYVMGGLVKDITAFYEAANDIGAAHVRCRGRPRRSTGVAGLVALSTIFVLAEKRAPSGSAFSSASSFDEALGSALASWDSQFCCSPATRS